MKKLIYCLEILIIGSILITLIKYHTDNIIPVCIIRAWIAFKIINVWYTPLDKYFQDYLTKGGKHGRSNTRND